MCGGQAYWVYFYAGTYLSDFEIHLSRLSRLLRFPLTDLLLFEGPVLTYDLAFPYAVAIYFFH